MVDSRQISHYICSKCNTILKEMPSSVGCQLPNSSEQCPTCGYQLSETLEIVKPGLQKKPSAPTFLEFQTAYSLNDRLTFDIAKIDNSISLSTGDRACIIGSRRDANLLVSRLFVRALMPQRHGGLESQNVICIDAGNCTNLYQCVKFARQYGMEVRQVLRSIIISRAFTIYQLAGLIIRKLPKVIERFKAKVVIISDFLKMFTGDPQVKDHEAKYLLQQIMKAIEQLPKDILLLISLYGPGSKYDNLIVPVFSKRVVISENKNQASLLQLRVFENKMMLSESSMTHADLLIVSTT